MNNKQLKNMLCCASCIMVCTIPVNILAANRISLLNKQCQEQKEIIHNLNITHEKVNTKIEEITNKNKSKDKQIKYLKQQIDTKNKEIHNMLKKVSYNPYNVGSKSNATTYHLRKAFKGTKMQGLESAFVKAEKLYGVNALFLAGLVATESSWNDSDRAKDGSNNITGHAVYHSTSRGSTFNTKNACILSTAKMLKNDYINPEGVYCNGSSIWGVNKMYCKKDGSKEPNMEWSNLINSIVNDLQLKANK